ncbi:MAG: hypothetical protein HUU29_12190 [Planctomycetaceae bacterium]|nr:hypothetical protein [Planctomycetaceae bacterium]
MSPPNQPPVENVKLFEDIPLPPEFVFSPDDPAPKTNHEGKRFARYGHTRDSVYSANECAEFYRVAMPPRGWTLVQDWRLDEDDGWHSRWLKGNDVLVIRYSQRSASKDRRSFIQSHIKIEVNTGSN